MGARFARAIVRARAASSTVSRTPVAPPITAREERSRTNAQTRIVFSPATADWPRLAPSPGQQKCSECINLHRPRTMHMRKSDLMMANRIGGICEGMWESDGKKR